MTSNLKPASVAVFIPTLKVVGNTTKLDVLTAKRPTKIELVVVFPTVVTASRDDAISQVLFAVKSKPTPFMVKVRLFGTGVKPNEFCLASKAFCKSVWFDNVPVIEPHVPPPVSISIFPFPKTDTPLIVLIFTLLCNIACLASKTFCKSPWSDKIPEISPHIAPLPLPPPGPTKKPPAVIPSPTYTFFVSVV